MNSVPPPCRTVHVVAFRGNRSRPFAARFLKSLDDERAGRGPGPTPLESLLFAGHAGLSVDGGTIIWGIHPNGAGSSTSAILDILKNGGSLPAIVRDDTSVFATARSRGLQILSFAVILPEPPFLDFVRRLDGERRSSQYSYGFPNGDGDCNCVTWIERLGLPLLTARMSEFCGPAGVLAGSGRRFGRCV